MAAKLLGERLPPQWSYGVTRDGRIFFIDDQSRQTTWVHPLTGEPVQTGYSTLPDLPAGWEQALTIDGTVYYLDHNRRVTTFDHPITGQPLMKSGDRFGTLISPGMGGPARKGSGKARGIKTPSAARGENSKVILRGWLQKQDSGALKLWKKKWCVLADFGLFFYKDEGESNCIGSILLPSYDIKQCKANEVNKKFAFKAEHENMKTFYFAADNQVEMDKWVEALRMASLVQRAPGSGHLPKLIPKSPIMSWDDDVDSPGISPPDMQQYPFSGNHGETSKRRGPDMDSSFQDRQSLQPSLNLQNYGDPYQGQGQQNDYRPGNGFGTFPRNDRGQGQGPRSTNGYGPSDPRYPPDRMDRNRGSQRSNLSQGHSVHDDQRSMSSQRSNQYPSNTMPRNMRPNQFDNSVRPNQLDSSMRSVGSQRSQGYNSLPRDSRSQLGPPIEGQDRPYGHSSPRQPPPNQTAMKGKEDNPYMMMTPHSQQRNERKMDPLKHSNRPLPQEPPPEPLKEKGRSGGGDYASLTRIREKWPNQQLSDRPGVEAPIDREEDQPVLSPTQQRRPDLYVDVPHTYVNVYDESQVRNRDQPPELPSRPPLPVEMRPKLVEDIASSRSPNTQKEMLMAERNLETRMQQPSFFNYPTPTRESLPAFPQNQDSPRSQYSQRSQRSNEQRSQQPSLPQRPDTQQRKPNGPVAPGFTGGQGQKGKRSAAPIQTVKEEPDMPDSQVLQTDLPKRNFLLDGPRLRMSISATDLLGKTHDELVLLLIQLRRDKADLTEQRDSIRKINEQNRPAEFYYRKMLEEGRAMDGEKEAQHRQYQDTKHKLEDVEKKLEVYKPLVNLVCNMVTMGSLYGGDNFMLATEYRKHLLSPEQYSPPKKMLEFSRRNQEEQIVKGIEEDVRHLTEEQADLESKELEEKLERLYSLDRVMQDQSFQVTSLKEDREMLEKALGGLLKKQDQHCTNPRELDVLIQQQKTIERELSRVLQQLAEASKELEETTAENNKLEHEVALLRSKVHGNVSRSKSAPALSSESLRTKMKMEKDLARVKNIMAGLSQEGARLQEMISTLKKPRPGEPGIASSQGQDQQDSGRQQGREGSTYFETDLDSGESKDLGQVTALLASFPRAGQSPGISSPPSSVEQGTSAFRTVSPSSRDVERTFHASPVQASPVHASPVRASPVQATIQAATQQQLETNVEMDGSPNQWDIGDADDNTKRFFGLIPKNLPKQQTVRDVKRNAEARKKKEDDPPPLRVGVIPSDYSDSVNHVYENLPQQKTAPADDTEEKKPWAPSVNTDVANPSGTQRRRSNLHLMTPKPFSLNSKPTPFTSVYTSFSTASQILPQTDAPLLNHNTQLSQSQPSFETMNFEKSQSNATYKPTEPIKMQHTNKTPPPPPVRDSSRYRTSEVNPQSFQDLFAKSPTNRNFDPPVPSILKKGKNNRALNKGRYMTISSSEPVKLEKSSPQSPKLHSQAGDLISSMDVPDIVKSSRARDEQIDERTIEREILYFPEKVTIPERYMPDSDDESVTEDEKAARREKADKIKRILTQQSVHSLSQPDVSKVAGEVHERVEREKEKRALLLGINQELAEQVKRKSLQYAAERRKTWSGSTNKQDMNTSEHLAESDTEKQGDDNNNSFLSPNPKHTRSPLDPKNSTPNSNSYLSTNNISYTSPINSYYDKSSPRKDENSYADSYGNENLSGHYNGNEYSREDNPYNNQYSGEGVEEYSRGDNSDRYEGGGQSSGYSHNMFTSTSYADRPNFKI
ncbi:uncharacterized protein LOC128230418 isoform X11 [Mya arenaria]|uniref:uncharacterized protein LOC128230418 isoform X11 n=1 Tax=Mya arenaria TaxID=6604 RepID=UPI0022E011DB|nr:uncharacterized protein LOC128230418 isoform X11 [Mya arenaria]